MSQKKQQILDWIQDKHRDYYYGINLLQQVSNKKSLIATLSRKKSIWNFNKLIYELQKHLPSGTIEQSYEKDETRPSSLQQASNEPAPGNENNELSIKKSNDKSVYSVHRSDNRAGGSIPSRFPVIDLSPLEDQKKMLYAERDHLHPQLMLVDSDDQRYELAKRISDISPKISKLNATIETIKQTGKIPMKMAVELLSAKDYKRLENVKVNIRRLKRAIEKPTSLKQLERDKEHLDKFIQEQEQLLSYARTK